MTATDAIVEKLKKENNLDSAELLALITGLDVPTRARLRAAAGELRDKVYGRGVFMRGLLEFTNYCGNDCLYCGIRRGNREVRRYRMMPEEIIDRCRTGHGMGFRTFVLQGGEDPWWDDDRVSALVGALRSAFPDTAITLSVGEKNSESYQKFYDAGADRYLLRHETATPSHYALLHPAEMALATRMECLKELRRIGFQVGAGFMVGSPYQTAENLVQDLLFLKGFEPHMIGIGPFIPHSLTPFAKMPTGSLELSIDMVALARLLLPTALIPATTALGTIDLRGREAALDAGANVVMPNLSPVENRGDYAIYDNKISTGEEAAESRQKLEKRLEAAGYFAEYRRGDHIDYRERNYSRSQGSSPA